MAGQPLFRVISKMSVLLRFVGELPGFQSAEAIASRLLDHMRPHGLRYYVFGDTPNPSNPLATPFFVSNLPEAWFKAYSARNFAQIDPVVRAALISPTPILLSTIREGRAGLSIGAPEQDFFDFAASLGIYEGLAIPVYGPRGHRGVVCFAGEGPGPEPANIPLLHLSSLYAYFHMFSLHAAGIQPNGTTSQARREALLSPREVEVLTLARGGAGDAQIAYHLGISVRTVRFHFGNARQKLGCRSRTEAIIRADNHNLLTT